MISAALVSYVLTLMIASSMAGEDRGRLPSPSEGFHCAELTTCPTCLTCVSGTCNVHHDYCYIEGRCWVAGANNPADSHQFCKPLTEMLDWTEEYEDMFTKGVVLGMNLKDKATMEHLMAIVCESLNYGTTSYCRRNSDKCKEELCPLVGIQPTDSHDFTRPIDFKLRKCWMDTYYGDATKDVKWYLYAKMGISRIDIEDLCFGYNSGTDSTHNYWLIPECIMESVFRNISNFLEENLLIDINSIQGFCTTSESTTTTTSTTTRSRGQHEPSVLAQGEEGGTQMLPLYWGLIGLGGLLIIMVGVVVLVVCVRRGRKSSEGPHPEHLDYALTPHGDITAADTSSSFAWLGLPAESSLPRSEPPAYEEPEGGNPWVTHIDGVPVKE